jgi:cold shock CspA family protein
VGTLVGWCVHWDAQKGFGKVRGDDHVERFVHRDDLLDVPSLARGQKVEFVATESAKGPRAVAVRCRGPAWAAEQTAGLK